MSSLVPSLTSLAGFPLCSWVLCLDPSWCFPLISCPSPFSLPSAMLQAVAPVPWRVGGGDAMGLCLTAYKGLVIAGWKWCVFWVAFFTNKLGTCCLAASDVAVGGR